MPYVHACACAFSSERTCTVHVGDCLISRPKGRSRPRELWFSIYSCTCTGHTCTCILLRKTVHV